MSLSKVLAKKVAFKNNPCMGEDREKYVYNNSAPLTAKKIVLRITKLGEKGINNLGENMSDNTLIINFLKSINEKNYARAHKYLKRLVENKLMNKIKNIKGVKLF
jgi:hypothetical protein